MQVDEQSADRYSAPPTGTPSIYYHSPVPTVESVGDIPTYWEGRTQDNSEYNTDGEDMGGEGVPDFDDHDPASSEMGIDEELAQIA